MVVVSAVRPTGWVSIEVAVVKAVGPTVRDSFPLKWKLTGCCKAAFANLGDAMGQKLEQKRLELYKVDMKLIRNMHNMGDDHVFSVSPQAGKNNRPFLGIVIICDTKQYCIPLSSPKERHRTMKNSLDFHRVLDSNGKLIGVLDINNMIPVNNSVITKVNIKISKNDTDQVKKYKNLVIDQITFCRKNQEVIVAKANRLYRLVNKGKGSFDLKKRCLRWDRLEKVLERYLKTKTGGTD